MGKVFVFVLSVFLIGCAGTSKVPIHEVVGLSTLRTKVLLLPSKDVDIAYQERAVREFEAVLLRKPAGYFLKTVFGGEKVDLVLITRKKVQRVSSISEAVKVGKESDVSVVVVVEPLRIDFSEGSVKREDEFCTVRRSEAVISAKVVESGKGKIVLAGMYEGSSEGRQCSKGVRRTDKLPSKDVLVIKAVKEAATKFSKEFWSSL